MESEGVLPSPRELDTGPYSAYVFKFNFSKINFNIILPFTATFQFGNLTVQSIFQC
jgi:hypothetical protein